MKKQGVLLLFQSAKNGLRALSLLGAKKGAGPKEATLYPFSGDEAIQAGELLSPIARHGTNTGSGPFGYL